MDYTHITHITTSVNENIGFAIPATIVEKIKSSKCKIIYDECFIKCLSNQNINCNRCITTYSKCIKHVNNKLNI